MSPLENLRLLKWNIYEQLPVVHIAPALDVKNKTFYWYSPEAKYFVKAKYGFRSEEVKDWELNYFKLIK
jgi:hypothetical protein